MKREDLAVGVTLRNKETNRLCKISSWTEDKKGIPQIIGVTYLSGKQGEGHIMYETLLANWHKLSTTVKAEGKLVYPNEVVDMLLNISEKQDKILLIISKNNDAPKVEIVA